MRKRFLLILAPLLIISCSSGSKEKIISKKRLVPLLIDMHIADATALNYSVNEHFGRLDSSLLYSTVLNSHDCTKEQMITTLDYYSTRTEELQDIYDEVYAKLSKQAEETKKLHQSSSLSMTHRIWKAESSRYIIKGDTVEYPPIFDFELDSFGLFVLNAEIKMTPEDSSENPRLRAYFYNPLNDSPESRVYFDEINIRKSQQHRVYILFKEQLDTNLSRARIMIPFHETKDSLFHKSMELHNLRLSLMESDDK